ncbi:hypothetical protein ACM749_26640 [Pseudomonas aeruginosa]
MSHSLVYHATSATNAEKILNGELSPRSYITSCLQLAEYYAETFEDEGEDAVILAFQLPADAVRSRRHLRANHDSAAFRV